MCSEATGGRLDFCSVYMFFGGVLPDGMNWLAYGLAGLSLAFLVINALVIATALNTWFERRAIGRFQSRLGPTDGAPWVCCSPSRTQ